MAVESHRQGRAGTGAQAPCPYFRKCLSLEFYTLVSLAIPTPRFEIKSKSSSISPVSYKLNKLAHFAS